MGLLDGKVAIVTGAGKGIGKGVSVKLAKEGANVVVAERMTYGEHVAEEIKGVGGSALFVQCDVGDKASVADMVAKTIEAYGTVDILVNCAQSWGAGGKELTAPQIPIEEFPEDIFDSTFHSGMKGTLYCSTAVFPLMKAKGKGRIINFSSKAGMVGWKGLVDYNCTKEAIRAFTRTAAREWGPHGITVNVICPLVLTEAVKAFREKNSGTIENSNPNLTMGKYADAEKDIGGLIVLLSMDYADMLTGQTIMIGEDYII